MNDHSDSNDRAPDVLVVGSSNTDMVTHMDRMPDPGETVLANQFFKAAGGKGANQAVAAARLGADVSFVGRVGDDVFGRDALDHLQAEQIDVRFVTSDDDRPSGVALIFVDDSGENSIAVAPGANDALSTDDVERAGSAIQASEVLLAQLEVPVKIVTRAAEIADEHGTLVVLNPAPAQDLPSDLYEYVSVMTPNESEAGELTEVAVEGPDTAERAAKTLLNRGVEHVVVTLGPDGALMVSSSEVQHVPGYDVEATDTTAAGDAFNGALCCALSEGRPLPDAVAFANRAGALAASKEGAQPSMPERDQVDGFSNA